MATGGDPEGGEPSQLDVLSSDYLGAALGRPGMLASVESTQIGTGQLGSSFLVELNWADGSTKPTSLVAKLPSQDHRSRRFGIETGHYAREILFYESLAPSVAIRTPRVFHLDLDASVILMEDLSACRPGDQLSGCSDAQARLAIKALGGLHGPRWNDVGLLEFERLQRSGSAWSRRRQESFRSSWSEFVDRYRQDLPDSVLRMGGWLHEELADLLRIERSAFCLVHNDYRPDNLLFGESGGTAPELAAVDWQTCAVGSGPGDAAYFIGGSLRVDQRRAIESDLWHCYLDGLRRHLPAEQIDPDKLWIDYRLGTLLGLVTAVIAARVAERTARGDELFVLMARRHAQHMLDLDLPGLIAATPDAETRAVHP